MTEPDVLKRILIFDDDADQRRLLLTYLGKMFESVELEQYDPLTRGVPPPDFDWSRYDVLILDYYLSLQGVTGLDILHQNRKNPAFPATIMLTGAGNEEVAMRALKAGVYDYLRKQSLDKQELKNSILLAFEKHKQVKKRLSELTQQGAAFSKSLFYQQLEYRRDAQEFRRRVLLLLELDNHETIEESAGVILRDNIVRHIARQSYEVFKLGQGHPVVTRLGDYSIALLIDAPDKTATLEFNLKGLLNHLEKRPYSFGDKKYPFTISIGAVMVEGNGETADNLIHQARFSCKTATKPGVSSYHIYSATAARPATRISPATPAPIPVPSAKPVPVDQQTRPAARPDTAPIQSKPVATPTSPAGKKPVTVTPAAAPIRPQKSLEELKAEAARPRTAVKAPIQPDPVIPVPAPAVSPESDPEFAMLDVTAHGIKNAFDEKRVVQLFQPVISLMNAEMDSEDEIHKVSLQLVDPDGKLETAADIKAAVNAPALSKFIDRWLLREVIGRVTNSNRTTHTFIVDLGDASLADAGFFNWLRKLLTGLDARNPGKFIALEIDAKHLTSLEKQANALITYLRKTHDFKFVLGNIDNADEIALFASRIKFDLIRCGHQLIGQLAEVRSGGNSQLELIKSTGSRFIADNIGDATTLTEMISLGAEYATGEFIGEPTPQLDDITNIETFEIT